MKEKIIAFFDDVVKEMKKVTWPSVEELKESTTVVIVSCLMLAAFHICYRHANNSNIQRTFKINARIRIKMVRG